MEYVRRGRNWYEVDYIINWYCPEHGRWAERCDRPKYGTAMRRFCPYRQLSFVTNDEKVNGVCPDMITGYISWIAECLRPETVREKYLAGYLPVSAEKFIFDY